MVSHGLKLTETGTSDMDFLIADIILFLSNEKITFFQGSAKNLPKKDLALGL